MMKPLTKKLAVNMHMASLLLSAGSVLAGLAASVLRGGVVLFPAIMTLLCAILFQLSSNLYYSYRKIRTISEESPLNAPGDDSTAYLVMKTLSNVFAILAATMAVPLFLRLKWVSLIYVVVIGVIVYFHFGGPRPLIRTRWSALVTFLLFGPIAVSGTALIQNRYNPDCTPIIVYSAISGLLAVNVHLVIQHLRRIGNVRDGVKFLLSFGDNIADRYLYVVNILIVCSLLILCRGDFGFDSHWIGILLCAWLFVSTFFVCSMMRHDDSSTAKKLRWLVLIQYVSCMIALLCIVLVSMEDYWFKLLMVK